MPLSASRAGVTVPAVHTARARRAAGIVTLAALAGAVGLGRYIAGSPGLLHLRVPEGPVAAIGGLAALALAAFVVLRPAAALLLLVGVVYLNLSDVLVRMGAPSVLQLLAVPILLAAVMSRNGAELARLARHPLGWLLAAYVLLLLATTTYAARPELAAERVGEAARGFAIFSLVLLLAATSGRVRLAAWGMLAAGAFLGLLGVYQDLTGDFDRSFGGLARSKQAQIFGDVFEPRIAGPLGDPNFFAQILLVLVPVGLFLAWGERRAGRRLVAFGLVAAVVAGTLLTYSRGGALALTVVVVLSLLGHGVDWRRIVAGGSALVLATAFLLPSGFAERLTTIAQLLPGGAEEVVHLDTSFEERRLLTGTAWEIFVDHPLLGVGAGNFTVHYAGYAAARGSAAPDYNGPGTERLPHSLFLEVAAETGLVGLALLAAALAAAFAALLRARRAFRDAGAGAMAGLAGGFAIALVGYLASSVFLHGAFQRYLWLLLGVAAALEAAAPARRRPGPGGDGEGPPPPRSGPAPAEHLPAREGAWGVRVRRPVAVILSRFPSVTETFVLREVIEMERQGQPVLLVPLMREHPPVVHAEARPWMERALYTPLLSLPVATANLRMLARHPLRYGGLLARLLAGSWWSPRYFLATAGFFPKSVYLAERLRSEGVRHVHAHFATHPATAALVVAELTGSTFSFTVHAHDLLSRKYRPLLALKVRRARFVRLISEYNRDFLLRLLPDTPPEKLHIVHVGIEPEGYTSDADAAAESGPVRLLTIAGFKPYKGLPVLLAAARRLRDGGLDFRWDIVGDGPQRAEIERGVREQGLGPYVHLTGALPQDEVGRRLRRRPLYVQPSVILSDGWMEGIPVALMEAMAAGAPVIASRLSGIPELVVDGVTGLLVEPGDPEALAAAVLRVAGDAELARHLGGEGSARVDAEFRLDRCVSHLLDLLDRHDEPIEPAQLEGAVASVGKDAGALRIGIRRVHAGPDSYVAELVVPGSESPREWVLKAHREVAGAHRSAGDRARSEFAALRELAPALGGSCLVPEPVSIDETHAVVVMEACPGERLADVLRQARTARGGEERLTAAVAAAGRWLREFQDATASPADAVAAHAAWRAAAEADLARCLGLLPAGLANRIPATLDALERSASANALRPVGHHGDLWPGNLFIDGERVSAIDFEGYRRGLAYEDAAYFVVQLEGFFDYPGLRALGRRLAGTFLSTYLADEPLNDAGYRLMRATKALQVLAHSGAGSRRRRVRLVRTIEGVLR